MPVELLVSSESIVLRWSVNELRKVINGRCYVWHYFQLTLAET